MSTITPDPPKKTNRHRPRPPALSRQQDDAVRRVRAQRDLRAHHRRVLRDGASIRSRSSSSRASAARARARPTSWARRTASTPCTAGCRRWAPARCWRTGRCIAIGVSGDGDTGAIGIGQFVHLMRRNLPIVYIIEDNGCYGLTKGQFSPTADLGSKPRTASPTICRRSTPARWRSSSARRSSRARSRATRSSCCRSSRRRSATRARA